MRLKFTIILLVPFFCFAQSALEFNKQGFEYYKQKNYNKAIELFETALIDDPSFFPANYNLACTYAILTTKDSACNIEFYVNSINALKSCILLDSAKAIAKAKNDPDFKGLRNEYEFNVLINGLNFSNPKYVREFIVGRTYITSAPGSSYYPLEELTLNDNNTWVLSFHANADEMNEYWNGDEVNLNKPRPKIVNGYKKGKWKLDGHTLTLLDKSGNIWKKTALEEPYQIDEFLYPDPNDMSGDNTMRHYWKCGNCGCEPIEGFDLN